MQHKHKPNLSGILLITMFCFEFVMAGVLLGSQMITPDDIGGGLDTRQYNGESRMDSPRSAAVEPIWWNGSWDYRLPIEINATSLKRVDSLFEITINFTDIFINDLGITGETFDFNSIRIIEYDPNTGDLIVQNSSISDDGKYEVVYSISEGPGYDADSNAYVKLSWVLNGTTDVNEIRTYNIYFDALSNGPKDKPDYWQGAAYQLDEIDSYANSNYDTSPLYVIENSKIKFYVSGECSSRTYYQGTVARIDNKDTTFTPQDNRIFDENYFYFGGDLISLDISNVKLEDNKVIVPIPTSSGYNGNVTYEVFPNTPYARMTITFKKADATAVSVRWRGDMDFATDCWHKHKDIDEWQDGSQSDMDANSTYGWTSVWHKSSYVDLWGVIADDTSHAVLTTVSWDSFYYDDDAYFTKYGDSYYGTVSFYIVNTEIGTINPYDPISEIYQDLIENPKTYTLSTAQKKRATIYVTVVDDDGHVVPNAQVFLNFTGDWDASPAYNQSATTDEYGRCSFTQLKQGDYNFTINITSHAGMLTVPNNGSEAVSFIKVNNYVTLKANIWRIRFKVLDADGNGLPHGWISINNTGTDYIENITLDSDGSAIFRWDNNVTEYAYQVYYNDSMYNGGNPILLKSGTVVNSTDHTTDTYVEINVGMARVNFTVTDEKDNPIVGTKIMIYNSSNADGTPNLSDNLVNLTLTDSEGHTTFYWRTRSGSEGNYSLRVQLAGIDKEVNNTNYPYNTWASYQNFTMTSFIEKTIVVHVDTTNYLTELIAVNDNFINTYWNESLVVQALYKHKAGLAASWEYAAPTWIRYTLKDPNGNIIDGPKDMDTTTQTGRYEVALDFDALGMTVGNTYTLKVEALESGFQAVEPITYYIKINKVPTELTTTENSADLWWGDILNRSISYDATYSNLIQFESEASNVSTQEYSVEFTRIINDWNLTKILFNFTNVQCQIGTWGMEIQDPSGNTIGTISGQTDAEESIIVGVPNGDGPWEDDNLTFTIIPSGAITGYDVAATAYYMRTGIVINYTADNLYGNSTVSVESPGNEWQLTGMELFIESSSSVPTENFNFTLANRTTVYAVDSDHEVYNNLDYFLNPESGTIDISFHNNSNFEFNATFVMKFAMVLDRHYYSEYDIQLFSEHRDNANQFTMNLDADKNWDISTYTLYFTDFKDENDSLVMPSSVNLTLTSGGITYTIPDGESSGNFYITIAAASPDNVLDFTLSMKPKSYNLRIVRDNRWTNYWGLSDAEVFYSVRSTPTINGTLDESSELSGVYELHFNTALVNEGNEILELQANLENYDVSNLDISLHIYMIETSMTVDQTSIERYWLENFTLEITYMNKAKSTFISDGEVSWVAIENPLFKGTFNSVGNGVYRVEINTTELAYAGEWTLRIDAKKAHYQTQSKYIYVTIKEIYTLLNESIMPIFDEVVVLGQHKIFYFNYSGRVGGEGSTLYKTIPNADYATYEWSYGDITGSGVLQYDSGLGLYYLDFKTEVRALGTYKIAIRFQQPNYVARISSFTIRMEKRNFSVSWGDELTSENPSIAIVKGNTVTLTISVKDELNENELSDAKVYLRFIDSNKTVEFQPVEGNPGVFTYTFTTDEYEAFYKDNVIRVQIIISKTNYTDIVKNVQITVKMEEIFDGVPTFYFIIGVAVVSLLIAEVIVSRAIRNAKIPAFIKLLEKEQKLMKAEKELSPENVTVSMEDEIIEKFADYWAVLDLDLSKILKGDEQNLTPGDEKGGEM